MDENFSELVQRIMTHSDIHHMQPVIEKELLHYDIIYCLDRAGLLDELVFQGGTSLRLCHQANRFSEDLDFAGGINFSAKKLYKIKECIEEYIGTRYGLKVTVKEPAALKKLPEYAELNIEKWQISVITSPERKDFPQQKIKLEIANIPAHQPEPVALNINYDFLPDGYSQTIVVAESLNEILADKVISLASTQNYIRYRDVWDIAWLLQQKATLDVELVKNKVVDYRIDQYDIMLSTLIENLHNIVTGSEFKQQMLRFLPMDVVERTLNQDKFISYLENTLKKLFKDLHDDLKNTNKENEFLM